MLIMYINVNNVNSYVSNILFNYMVNVNAHVNLLKEERHNLYNRYLMKKTKRRLHYMYIIVKTLYTFMHSCKSTGK